MRKTVSSPLPIGKKIYLKIIRSRRRLQLISSSDYGLEDTVLDISCAENMDLLVRDLTITRLSSEEE